MPLSHTKHTHPHHRRRDRDRDRDRGDSQQNPLRRPPPDGRCPIARLPDELWLEILSRLDWKELVAIRGVSRHVSALVLSPSLHTHMTLACMSGRHLPRVLTEDVLPLVRHLYIADHPPWSLALGRGNLSAAHDAVLEALGAVVPDRLLTLSIRCSAPPARWGVIGEEIARIGGTLEHLDLHGARLESPFWGEWMQSVGVRGRGLAELDLGVSGITTLPRCLPFEHLRSLSLRSCYLLQSYELNRFLANLPPKLRALDLSYMSQLSLDALYDLRVTVPSPDGNGMEATALNTINLVGIDHLTRSDIRSLQLHWSETRMACSNSNSDGALLQLESSSRRRTSSLPAPPSPIAIAPPGQRAADAFSSTSLSLSSPSSPTPSSPSTATTSSFTPRTPESDSSDAMPATPTSAMSVRHESSGLLHFTDGGPWEIGMFDDAMFTPLPRPRVLFPFDGLQFAHSGNKQRMLIAGKRAAGRGNGDATRIGTGIGTGVGTGIGDPADEDSTKVWIFHSALLESDDEEGYRRFIGEVVDGTLAPVWPALL